jgi:transketolase
VQLAQSGHPGAPLGMAEIAEVLWRRHLRHNPANPAWPERDRFVLSNGHASMLLYALLHLTGYDLPIEELKRFRQLGARTPGHPEVGLTPGVETTTGPLGQGLANAVGMALAEQQLAAAFNRPGHDVVDHRTWVFAGDGCLMEGISHEACSLAGTLGLAKLVVFYDDNGISIDGAVDGWFNDDTPRRFAAYNWNVIEAVDGHDPAAIERAIAAATSQHSRPTLICCRTVIGHGAPTRAGSHEVHGAPLGAEEIAAMRTHRNWPSAPFEIAPELGEAWDARRAGAAAEQQWDARMAAYRAAHPELAAELQRRSSGALPPGWPGQLAELAASATALQGKLATRKASQLVLEHVVPALPELFGGSADLSASNLTDVAASRWVNHEGRGNYLSYGVREFGMAAIMNGMALHGGFIPYGGTFLAFSDYSRNAVRMAALMKLRVIHVFTHDSIGLGEDGPTHQPVEHVASLRLIPNNRVWRPCDGAETAIAWQAGAGAQRTARAAWSCRARQWRAMRARWRSWTPSRAAATCWWSAKQPQLVLVATGSEVDIAVAAARQLALQGVAVRVVSMPCVEPFMRRMRRIATACCRPGVPRVSVEAGSTWFWRGVVGDRGLAIGIDSFGESAPAPQLYEHFGLTAAQVAERALSLLEVA